MSKRVTWGCGCGYSDREVEGLAFTRECPRCKCKTLVPMRGKYRNPRVKKLEKLVEDLWWFVENVSDESPDRNERFFALRERVRGIW